MDGVNILKTIKLLNDEKIYHVGQVIENFSDYFGISSEEITSLFINNQTITKEELIDYIMKNQDVMAENQYRRRIGIHYIVQERLIDYYLLNQKLTILKHKGMNYLSLLQYVAQIPDLFHEDEFYELIFETLNISHYGKGMLGKHLKQLLIPLANIVKEIKILIEQTNNLENYHRQKFDFFARSYGEDKFYAVDNIVYNDDTLIVDKTAFNGNKCKKLMQK